MLSTEAFFVSDYDHFEDYFERVCNEVTAHEDEGSYFLKYIRYIYLSQNVNSVIIKCYFLFL